MVKDDIPSEIDGDEKVDIREVLNKDIIDWDKLEMKSIMLNEKYSGLYERREERLHKEMLLHEGGHSWEEIMKFRKELESEEDEDEKKHLEKYFDKKGYEIYTKYRRIYELESESHLDEGMVEILYEFQKLPFRSHQSCTGHPEHIFEDNYASTDYKFLLSFMPSWDVTEAEKLIQKQFVGDFANLNEQICRRLRLNNVNVLFLMGEFDLHYDGEQLTPEESLDRGYDIHMVLNLEKFGDYITTEKYKEVLNAVWEEFISYCHTHIKEENWEMPNFQGGEVFF
jgi:hypothetical protein